MINALNRKKKELEDLIESYNTEIAQIEVERESAEDKLAIVEEMIAEEQSKIVTERVETVKAEPEKVSEEPIVISYGSAI